MKGKKAKYEMQAVYLSAINAAILNVIAEKTHKKTFGIAKILFGNV